ncbi:MAG: L,D-transpeptidase family protein [Alphaproteobacteria bacterium]|nr:L,D-transpeptidase family protein [Alphaproteobacteria bacterium]
MVGEIPPYRAGRDDNLYALSRRNDVGIVEMLSANPGIDPWMPRVGTAITIPTRFVLPPVPREGIVINLAELRLYYYPTDATVMTFPIGIGQEGWQTPTGATKIVKKRKDPEWRPPASIRAQKPELPEVVPAGPDNPMGAFALNLGWPSYAIHGTNRPYGIGRRSSHGCIRMYPEDIATLFAEVKEGTPVTVVDVPYKLGWYKDTLWLEVSPTQEQSDEIAQYMQPAHMSIPELYDAITAATEGYDAKINWYIAETVATQRTGVPTGIAWRNIPALPPQ